MNNKTAVFRSSLKVTLLVLIVFIAPPIVTTQNSAALKVESRFLEDPPYRCSWLPWIDTRFMLEVSVCNFSDSTWAIPRFAPCNDCNPKIFLVETKTGLEPKRAYELDVLYYFDDDVFCELESGDCYVDTIDFAKYIEWDLSDGSSYKVWLEYQVDSDHKYTDTTKTDNIWRGKLVSDTLLFLFD